MTDRERLEFLNEHCFKLVRVHTEQGMPMFVVSTGNGGYAAETIEEALDDAIYANTIRPIEAIDHG